MSKPEVNFISIYLRGKIKDNICSMSHVSVSILSQIVYFWSCQHKADQAIATTSVSYHRMAFHHSQGVLLFVSASILRAVRETTSQHKFADPCAGICLEVVTRCY